MKRIATIALIAGLAGTTAIAEQHTMNTDELIRARDIVDSDIYSIGTEMDDASWDAMDLSTNDDGWTEIGEVEDVVLDQSGQMVGIVAEIGGFLDIGDKHVMLEVGDVRLSPRGDGEYIFVTRQTEEQLEELPSVDESFME